MCSCQLIKESQINNEIASHYVPNHARKRKGPIYPYTLGSSSSSPHVIYANSHSNPDTHSHSLYIRVLLHSLTTPPDKVLENMIKLLTFLLLLAFIFTFSQAESIISQPQPQSSFKLQDTQVRKFPIFSLKE